MFICSFLKSFLGWCVSLFLRTSKDLVYFAWPCSWTFPQKSWLHELEYMDRNLYNSYSSYKKIYVALVNKLNNNFLVSSQQRLLFIYREWSSWFVIASLPSIIYACLTNFKVRRYYQHWVAREAGLFCMFIFQVHLTPAVGHPFRMASFSHDSAL